MAVTKKGKIHTFYHTARIKRALSVR